MIVVVVVVVVVAVVFLCFAAEGSMFSEGSTCFFLKRHKKYGPTLSENTCFF